MHSVLRWAVVVCAALAATAASAQNLVLTGTVSDDAPALAVRTNFAGMPNVAVKLYRDGGDSLPTADDALQATVRTGPGGAFTFRNLASGNYWVAVDSRTLHATAWPEQTFGPAGSLCGHPDGSTRNLNFEGSCFGGRGAASDDASSLVTSEHVALVRLTQSATAVDFAFSADAVTTTADGDRIQGSLRQFILNANALAGPNRMRFVPLSRAPEQRETTFGVPPRWWSMTLGSPLPDVTGEDTVIDGTAYNFLSAASVADAHPGRLGEAPTIKPNERIVPRLEKPELDLALTGAAGLVCAARCGVRAVALHGTPAGIVVRDGARIEHVLVGAAPDAEAAAEPGSIGVQIERGTVIARHLYVTGQTQAGIVVRGDAQLDGERLDVSRCGDLQSGGGIVLLSSGSSVRSSVISSNPGAGIIIASTGGGSATANTIDGCTISGNGAGVVLGAGSSRNVITRNDIMWNRLGGVANGAVEAGAAPPRENRLSANRFDENGLRPIVLAHAAENPNSLSRGVETCDRDAGQPNNGISAPRITQIDVQEEGTSARVTIRGRACPGEIIELYQSFVTTGVREKAPELPMVRDPKKRVTETLTTTERELALPSIGEFNYLGATNTQPDGTFEAVFPLPMVVSTEENRGVLDEASVWAHQVMPGVGPSDRAFSAIAIDAQGNTSEMSVRRRVD